MGALLLAIIYLAFISLGLPDSLLGAGWPTMYPELGAPVAFAGLVSALISCGTITSSLLSDRLTHRLGAGLVTAVSTLLTALGLFGFSISRSFWQLCLWTIPYGLGAGAIDAALNNYVALHYSSRHMSWLHCCWGVGAAISPNIMSFALTRGTGWPAGYRIVGVIQLCLTAALFLSLPLWKTKEAAAQTGEAAPQGKPLGLVQAWKLPGAACVFIAFFCYCSMESTAGLWASSFLTLGRGVAPETAARFASLFYLGITLGRFLSGFISPRLGDRRMIRLGLGIILLGAVAVALPLENDTLALAGLLVIGLGCAPVYPSFIHATPALFGAEKSQAIIGIQMACAYAGSLAMPPLFGLLAEHVNVQLYPYYLALFALVAGGMLWRLYHRQGQKA